MFYLRGTIWKYRGYVGLENIQRIWELLRYDWGFGSTLLHSMLVKHGVDECACQALCRCSWIAGPFRVALYGLDCSLEIHTHII